MPASEMEYKDFSLALQNKAASQNRFIKIQFELTYACNLHCVHCYTDPLNRPELLKKELPYGEVIKAIDKLYEEGFLWICFTGGEIFMRKDFLEIYDYAYDKGFMITLFTNGTLITEEIADHLAEFPPLEIEISFHGASPETFDTIAKVPGSFERCVSGIKMLLARNLPVDLKTKAMTLNHHELGQIQAFVESLGLKFHMNAAIYPRLDGDASSVKYRLSPEDILQLEFGSESVELCENQQHTPSPQPSPQRGEGVLENSPLPLGEGRVRGDIRIGVKNDLETASAPERLYRCGCGSLQALLDPYGKMSSCVWARDNRFDFREKSLQAGMTELAEKIRSQKYLPNSACYSCIAHEHCEKKPEMAVYEVASPQDPVQHFCNVAFGRLNHFKNYGDET